MKMVCFGREILWAIRKKQQIQSKITKKVKEPQIRN